MNFDTDTLQSSYANDYINTYIHDRQKYLEQKIKQKKKAVQTAPEGSLRAAKKRNHFEYYCIPTKGSDFEEIQYLHIHEEEKTIRRLAQKEYDKKCLKALELENKALEAYLKNSPPTRPEEIIKKLHPLKRDYITSLCPTDEEFVNTWIQEEYIHKEVDGDCAYNTDQGERVRSKSEALIANKLKNHDIPYKYEKSLYLKSYDGYVYPDFTCLNVSKRKVIYWEHLGMMQDPDYSYKAMKKLQSYADDGIILGDNLIITFEGSELGLDTNYVDKMIQHFLN